MPTISLARLAIAFLPVIAVVFILHRWRMDSSGAIYAIARMLGQLLLVGFALEFFFENESSFMVLCVLAMMMSVSTWIALGTSPIPRRVLYPKALLAIALGGGLPLLLCTCGVLDLTPWFSAQRMIPLAGMSFAAAMTSISLAVERAASELERGESFESTRNTALRTALIPITNSLFAVGLVSLPGMMTGQILAGVSPFIAARYQIMIMCLIFASSGLAAAWFLQLARHDLENASVS